METKGTILKQRIKQMGYTQTEFAEECQISISALKQYITDELPYSITLLERFSEKLDCSTDYLLARSETPIQELHSLKEQTHLSDAALLALEIENHDYCREIKFEEDELRKNNARNNLAAISLVLEDEELVYSIQQMLFFDEKNAYFGDPHDLLTQSKFVIAGNTVIYANQIKGMLMMNIIDRLNVMREKYANADKDEILSKEVSEDVKERTRKWLNS